DGYGTDLGVEVASHVGLVARGPALRLHVVGVEARELARRPAIADVLEGRVSSEAARDGHGAGQDLLRHAQHVRPALTLPGGGPLADPAGGHLAYPSRRGRGAASGPA